MKIRLNVATRPLEGHRRFVAGAAIAAAVGVGALLLLSTSVYRTWLENRGERAEIAGYQQELASLRREQVQLSSFFDSPQTKTVVDRAAFLNSLIDERSFPWTKIFVDLEKALPPGVRVISIAPKMDGGQVDVKLEVGATGDKSLNDFLSALQTSTVFTNLQVIAVTPATQTGSTDVKEAQLDVIYAGAAEGQ